VEFANGTPGHPDLTVAVRMDWHEGFQICGAQGPIMEKTYNPWYYKSSEADIFHESDGSTHRVLGADRHFYRRQLEGFADTILNGTPQTGADIEDGIASVRAMGAIAQSARTGQPVTLAEVSGAL
jgi:predicted dehydrogenase